MCCRIIYISIVFINDWIIILIEYYLGIKDESLVFVLFCIKMDEIWGY